MMKMMMMILTKQSFQKLYRIIQLYKIIVDKIVSKYNRKFGLLKPAQSAWKIYRIVIQYYFFFLMRTSWIYVYQYIV